jgi:hypothetical protein
MEGENEPYVRTENSAYVVSGFSRTFAIPPLVVQARPAA